MSEGVLLVLIVVYVGLAVGVGAYAEDRGRSPLMWTVLSIIFSPPIGLLAAYFEDDQAKSAPTSDHLTQLKTITQLRDAGALTAEEFESEKARILESRA